MSIAQTSVTNQSRTVGRIIFEQAHVIESLGHSCDGPKLRVSTALRLFTLRFYKFAIEQNIDQSPASLSASANVLPLSTDPVNYKAIGGKWLEIGNMDPRLVGASLVPLVCLTWQCEQN